MSTTRTSTVTAIEPVSPKAHLSLSPNDLYFTPTRSHVGVIARISLQNNHPSKRPVGYKLKTNAPARYSVKPVLGVLLAGATVDVLVRSESAIHPDDRFLLQTIFLTDEESTGLNAAKWRTLDRRRMADIFIDCKPATSRPRGLSAASTSSSSSAGTSTTLRPSPTKNPGDVSVRVTPLDVVVFSCLCLVLGILMPYRSLAHLVDLTLV
ncbi:hypothetical protein SpCBS45565_g06858 [Spizellomyces sp. 'palustris']|nr:hypothetical protein SpCBS45565_g06858 [Spizellomyces sp. 'palustris']